MKLLCAVCVSLGSLQATAPHGLGSAQGGAAAAAPLAAARYAHTSTHAPLQSTQIYDLETKYLEHCNPVGNALKGALLFCAAFVS